MVCSEWFRLAKNSVESNWFDGMKKKNPWDAGQNIVEELVHTMATDGLGWGLLSQFFSILLFSTFSVIVKTNVSCWISHSYLAGFAAAQLRWHLSNMNVIQGI